MSSLGCISGKVDREQRLLSRLNEAVIALEADALGKREQFCLSDEDVRQSRETLRDFVERLRKELQSASTSADFEMLAPRIRSGMKPVQDWLDDLSSLGAQLRSGNKVKLEDLPTLEEVLSLLDDDFAEDLRRLYQH